MADKTNTKKEEVVKKLEGKGNKGSKINKENRSASNDEKLIKNTANFSKPLN